MIWANPIFRRYCRSRLRPQALGIALLLAVIVAGFLYFMSSAVAIHRSHLSAIDAARATLVPLLVLQGLIVFLLGTGQVAAGMTAEGDEGVLDYQRLAPMSPLAKVVGYLFGLPIREYAMLGVTLPFTAWALWRGEVPFRVWGQLYGVFLTSAILYHLTGLVAGTVVRNRRWAFLVSIGVVFLLYTIVPQMAKFGLVYFKYLTLTPVFQEMLPHIIPGDMGAALESYRRIVPSAKFFNLDLPEAVFSVFSQGALILTFVVMLWRRWRRSESHLLGKVWAVGLFGWLQVVLLGNALPLIEPGYLFPTREFARVFGRRFQDWSSWRPEPMEAVGMIGLYGLVTLLVLWTFTLMITPDANEQVRGWRRARKLGRRSIHPLEDAAGAFGWVAAMAVIGAAGWFAFAASVVGSRWFPGQHLTLSTLAAFALVFGVAAHGFHALLEARGARSIVLAAVFVGVVPLMTGSVVAAISDRLAAPATWIIALSPASSPAYASATLLPISDVPLEIARAVPRAFWFWQGVGAIATLWLVSALVRSRRAIARSTAAEPPAPEAQPVG